MAAGEVLHVDPQSGEAWAQGGREDEPGRAIRWALRPFDFAKALVGAARVAPVGEATFRERLAWFEGRGTPLPLVRGKASGPEEVWGLPLGLLWGPPGTGKTEALARLIVRNAATAGGRVLALAPTHVAADQLTLRTAALGAKRGEVVRIGLAPGASRELSRFAWQPPEDEKSAEREQLARALEAGRRSQVAASELVAMKRELRGLGGRTAKLPPPPEEGGPRVLVATLHRGLSWAADEALLGRSAQLLIDEAGMVPRAAALLVAGLARSALLAGDPRQLGPVFETGRVPLSRNAKRWLADSALAPLSSARAALGDGRVALLRTQHRMHPDVGGLVSAFAYEGLLQHGETVLSRAPVALPGLGGVRAGWLVLDRVEGLEARDLAPDRGEPGRGMRRLASVKLALGLARPLLAEGRRVICITPYRAQADLLARTAAAEGLAGRDFSASTVHRQQGSEADVVFIDTVSAGRPFDRATLAALLNVAASRAREAVLLLASRAEAAQPALVPLVAHLQPVGFPGEPFATPLAPLAELPPVRPPPVLRTQAQVQVTERRFDDGIHVVRGVAGSGKSLVLASWAARFLAEHPGRRVLLTCFTRSLMGLLAKLLEDALRERCGAAGMAEPRSRARIQHAHGLGGMRPGSVDAVFVDEAQDLDGATLTRLHGLVRPMAEGERKGAKTFVLFLDDAQAVHGHDPMETVRALLPPGTDLRGRVQVLREAFRSTRPSLDLAFNVLLDPHGLQGGDDRALRAFARSDELVAQGLLSPPDEELGRLWRVRWTDREGPPPRVIAFERPGDEVAAVARESARLRQEEGRPLGAQLLVVPAHAASWAERLQAAGIAAVAYGIGGRSPAEFPSAGVAHLRVTTLFSGKGHEAPAVLFAGLADLASLGRWRDFSGKGPEVVERARRAMTHIGLTRAAEQTVVFGHRGERLFGCIAHYAKALR